MFDYPDDTPDYETFDLELEADDNDAEYELAESEICWPHGERGCECDLDDDEIRADREELADGIESPDDFYYM